MPHELACLNYSSFKLLTQTSSSFRNPSFRPSFRPSNNAFKSFIQLIRLRPLNKSSDKVINGVPNKKCYSVKFLKGRKICREKMLQKSPKNFCYF